MVRSDHGTTVVAGHATLACRGSTTLDLKSQPSGMRVWGPSGTVRQWQQQKLVRECPIWLNVAPSLHPASCIVACEQRV